MVAIWWRINVASNIKFNSDTYYVKETMVLIYLLNLPTTILNLLTLYFGLKDIIIL